MLAKPPVLAITWQTVGSASISDNYWRHSLSVPTIVVGGGFDQEAFMLQHNTEGETLCPRNLTPASQNDSAGGWA